MGIIPIEHSQNVEVAAFLAGRSLQGQLKRWQAGTTRGRVKFSPAAGEAGVERALRHAHLVVIDATAQPSLAADVFARAVEHLGAYAVSVYTEEIHDGLEFLVRRHGSWLLFGPLHDTQWHEFFARLGAVAGRKHHTRFSQRPLPRPYEGSITLGVQPMRRFSGGVRRPKSSA